MSFSRPHAYGEVFVDDNHFGWTGHRVVADILYDELFETSAVAKEMPLASAVDIGRLQAGRSCIDFVKYLLFRRTYLAVEESGMQEYLDYLSDEHVESAGRIGSVAVNCDPMTNGHLQLLEHAASSCDFLYAFVIEEEGSRFRFADRLKMVKAGVAHLSNVKVLRGGRYICTDVTVPEYSTKDENAT